MAIHTGDHSIDSGACSQRPHIGTPGAPVCRYEPLAIPPSKPTWYADRHHIPVDDGTGSWFLKLCGPNFGGVVYISRTDPAELLAAVRQRLVLPAPDVRFSPATVQVVQVPTWMWIDAASWQPQSSNVAVPGVSVSVRAWPVASVWTMGDGTTVQCAGPGTPFDPHHDDPARGSSCSHTYTTSSSSAPERRIRRVRDRHLAGLGNRDRRRGRRRPSHTGPEASVHGARRPGAGPQPQRSRSMTTTTEAGPASTHVNGAVPGRPDAARSGNATVARITIGTLVLVVSTLGVVALTAHTGTTREGVDRSAQRRGRRTAPPG